ncbi:hypothetical protein [Paenibacillus wulumuqiensis]|uniref:hypothetical protein n=1 Tax=Paenibacillus wulumuqiensis TaxID=1567107 RepID=UPI00061999F4|nr:hypothetical protein [Paenibacillus wulumuqiensis]
MRTEDQIKSKLGELNTQKRNLQARLSTLTPEAVAYTSLNEQLARINDMTTMLEWVLDQPQGKYHA